MRSHANPAALASPYVTVRYLDSTVTVLLDKEGIVKFNSSSR